MLGRIPQVALVGISTARNLWEATRLLLSGTVGVRAVSPMAIARLLEWATPALETKP